MRFPPKIHTWVDPIQPPCFVNRGNRVAAEEVATCAGEEVFFGWETAAWDAVLVAFVEGEGAEAGVWREEGGVVGRWGGFFCG